ncbi:MAG: sigma-70 family RNA polymerase sigma factor [Bacteroides sp.]|nr:sigma-70 family RNA polymerase sigma factor [Bacteroides sp.]
MGRKQYIKQITAIMEKHKQSLFRYACSRMGNAEDAEDILQDVYLRMLEKSGDGKEIDNLEAYIFRTVVNTCNARISPVIQTDLSGQEVAQLTEETADLEEEAQRITRLIGSMPAASREVVRLRIYASLTFDGIASTLNISTTTAKRRYYEGLEYLRLKLKAL